MKRKILSVVLSLALVLSMIPAMSVTAFAGVTDYGDYGIKVNGTVVTSSNAASLLGTDQLKYDSSTNTLKINGTVTSSSAISIEGNGTINIKIDGGTNNAVTEDLEISKVNDVTITTNCPAPTIVDSLIISCAGNINLENKGTGQIINASSFAANCKKNVNVSGSSSVPLFNSIIDITASGDIDIENTSGFIFSGDSFVANSEKDVTVSASSTSAALFYGNKIDITASGDIDIENKSSGFIASCGAFVANSKKNVTVIGSSTGFALFYGNKIDITASGDIDIENKSSGFIASCGAFVANSKKNVTVIGSISTPLLQCSDKLDITANGDINIENKGTGQVVSATSFTVNNAKNISIKSNSNDATLGVGTASIKSSGNVLIQNLGAGKAVYNSFEYNRLPDAGGYLVFTGDSKETLAYFATKSEKEDFSFTSDSPKVISISNVEYYPLNNSITAKYSVAEGEAQIATLKLTAKNLPYTGSPYTGAKLDKDAWEKAKLDVPTIMYKGRQGTVYNASKTAPTKVGKYTAYVVVDGKYVASADFEIMTMAAYQKQMKKQAAVKNIIKTTSLIRHNITKFFFGITPLY